MVTRIVATATPVLKSVITADLMNGLFNEIIGVIPVCIPVMVGFIGIRKGLSFVFGMMRSA